jgi:hypothetical protein
MGDPSGDSSGTAADGQSYVVQQGDCMSSIAQASGLFWQTIWNRPENAALKQTRADPNLLMAGDVVFVPTLKKKQHPSPPSTRTGFKLKGVPAKLKLRLTRNGQPRANVPYKLVVDGKLLSGTTDTDGKIEQPIPPDAQQAILTTNPGKGAKRQVIDLGTLDPPSTVSGAQGRLNNLGYNCGAIDGVLGDKTTDALQKFQGDQSLPLSGKLDDATVAALKKAHGY